MPNHHEIVIRLVGGTNIGSYVPPPPLRVGDTVSYSSPDGKARIFFPSASPHAVAEVRNPRPHKLLTAGRFQFQCFITPKGKTLEIGWDMNNAQAGGVHDVLPGE